MDLCFVVEVSAMYARIPVRSNGAPPEMRNYNFRKRMYLEEGGGLNSAQNNLSRCGFRIF